MFQVLEVAEDLLKRSHTCKGLEEKRVDMFPKEGAKMSKDAKDFLERLKKLRGTITDLDDQINKEFEKYSGDVRYFAEYQTGLQDFYPRLVEAEDRISEGLVTPQSLVESDNTLTDTKNFQTSLEELIKVLDNAGEIAKKMSHHEHADITVASFRIRWDNAHKVSVPQKKRKKGTKGDQIGHWPRPTNIFYQSPDLQSVGPLHGRAFQMLERSGTKDWWADLCCGCSSYTCFFSATLTNWVDSSKSSEPAKVETS